MKKFAGHKRYARRDSVPVALGVADAACGKSPTVSSQA
jgi:hypothetical protein